MALDAKTTQVSETTYVEGRGVTLRCIACRAEYTVSWIGGSGRLSLAIRAMRRFRDRHRKCAQ